jgi:phage baseplate assembly protein W
MGTLNVGHNAEHDKRIQVLQNAGFKIHQDLDIAFGKHPTTGDIVVTRGDIAIKRSIRNILFTDFGEKLFQPGYGSGIKWLLFEPYSPITEQRLIRMCTEAINNWEPRCDLIHVGAKANPDQNGYEINIVFRITSQIEPIEFTTFLTPTAESVYTQTHAKHITEAGTTAFILDEA